MVKKPAFRKLRGYAFDPSLSLQMETAPINDICYKIPWEELEPGPVGEYIEVIDYDPTVGQFYCAADLNHSSVLAQDGLDPSESNPQFHQQMLYAVVMLTIRNFEKALGRKVIWSSHRLIDQQKYEEYVQRLRIYPHAMREPNAFYSPIKKALLFGYFSSAPANDALQMPDSLVFTCLSHDIIAHETTHAILDGMHTSFNRPTNPDMLAFHEAFSDIVALFQHFTFPDVLRHQIAKTRGDLGAQNLLGQLAQEFGTAIGEYGSLRDAIGETDNLTGEWKPKKPNPDDYRTVMEPHARGSILVAAVFEAFISIYKNRVSDLVRIASEGTGILRMGALHPDLVNRLAGEAAKAAEQVLKMCIRALDYCPPMDLTFGDYLRAIITSDADLIADDKRDYRLAFIEAFRKRGIYPEGIRTLSVESLRFPELNIGGYMKDNRIVEGKAAQAPVSPDTKELFAVINAFLRDYADALKYVNDRKQIYDITRKYISGSYDDPKHIILGLHRRINIKFGVSTDFAKITGLAFVNNFQQLGVKNSKQNAAIPSFSIQSLRLASRVGPDGEQINHVIFSIIQRTGLVYSDGKFQSNYKLPDNADLINKSANAAGLIPEGGFEFEGACTLIFDLDSLQLKYAISKPLLDIDALEKNNTVQLNLKRADAQCRFQSDDDSLGNNNEYAMYFGNGIRKLTEPFAFLHQH